VLVDELLDERLHVGRGGRDGRKERVVLFLVVMVQAAREQCPAVSDHLRKLRGFEPIRRVDEPIERDAQALVHHQVLTGVGVRSGHVGALLV
jgi:hypothetical protein